MKTHTKQNCCMKRSILEKILIVVIVLLLCLLIALFTVFIIHLQNGKSNNFVRFDTVTSSSNNHYEAASPLASSIIHQNKVSTCMTQQCVEAAAQIINSIDPSVNPCDDFYGFVCGNFLNKTSGAGEISPLSKYEKVTLSQVDSLIVNPLDGPIPKSLELQRKYYKTCMDTKAIENDNSYTLLNLIKRLGDWPVLLGRFWNGKNFNWLTCVLESRNIGLGHDFFLSLNVENVANITRTAILSIKHPAVINVPFQFREFFIDVMANISIDLGAPVHLAKAEFTRVIEFEEHIRAIAEDERRNGQDAVVTLAQLQSEYPGIEWKYFLNQITKSSIPFTDDSMIHLRARRYLTNLLNLLSNTPASTQANYVVWKIIENSRNYLKESVRNRYESFLMVVDPNYSVLNNRHIFCLNNAKFYFPSVAELAYVRRFLPSNKRDAIKQMTLKIKNQLINSIKQNDWLGDGGRMQAINKVAKAEDYIGASDLAYDGNFDKVVDLENFDLSTDNIIEMTTKLDVRRTNSYFQIVNKPWREIDKEALEKTPVLSINAFFMHPFNTLVVPAPFVQGIIYNYQRPQYMNYGALGSVIGHEFTHSFVSHREISQWPTEARNNYEEKVKCLLDDYRQYNGHLAEFTKNAKSVLEENIADLVGPEVSYKVYQNWVRKYGQEPTLPSLRYTPNQLFWIMSGMFKCYQPISDQNLRFDDKHGVPSFALTSSVKNSQDFANDFNCPVGSNMNPQWKCRIL